MRARYVPGDLSSVGTEVLARRRISTSRWRKNRVVVASQISGDGEAYTRYRQSQNHDVWRALVRLAATTRTRPEPRRQRVSRRQLSQP